jgi:hypothetical protein
MFYILDLCDPAVWLVDTSILEEYSAFIFNPENENNMFLQNVGTHLPDYIVL